jgi:hypothetical protein
MVEGDTKNQSRVRGPWVSVADQRAPALIKQFWTHREGRNAHDFDQQHEHWHLGFYDIYDSSHRYCFTCTFLRCFFLLGILPPRESKAT